MHKFNNNVKPTTDDDYNNDNDNENENENDSDKSWINSISRAEMLYTLLQVN